MEITDGVLLRIFISEKDKHEGISLCDWIVRKARELGLAGATVFRGIEGFGVHSHIHSTKIIDMSQNLPMVIEIVDSVENIESLLPVLDNAIEEGMITMEKGVSIRTYRRAAPKG